MKNYTKSSSPFIVPTTDGKLIEEFLGLASSETDAFSVAHMVAPPGWSEPPQTPEFDEITIMISGKKQIIIEDEVVELNTGEVLKISKGVKVQYSNPYQDPAEYWSVCLPAFSINRVNREE